VEQVFQDMAKGRTLLVESCCPSVLPEFLLLNSTTSLISAGTERMLVDWTCILRGESTSAA